MRAARRSRLVRAPRTTVLALSALLLLAGASAVGVAWSSQEHAPQPRAAQAGTLGPHRAPALATSADPHASTPSSAPARDPAVGPTGSGRFLARSRPVSLSIPAIGVATKLAVVGRNPDGTIQVPPLFARPSEAAWYRYSPTPGQRGPSVIVGHVDNVDGPAVFFRLGSLAPGARIEVALASGTVAVFRVDGVRRYAKARFPTRAVYGPASFAALRLVTCGGAFDEATHHYLDNVVVFASLVASERGPARTAG